MFNFHGYWFYGLRDDKIVQSKDSVDEYWLLNCPQEYIGPFLTRLEAWEYKTAYPEEHKKFHQTIKEMEEFYYGYHEM